MSATLAIREAGHIIVVDVTGRITIGDASNALHDQLHELVASGHTKIVLNLSGVIFMDSAGIGELVSGYVTVSHKQGRLKLCALTKRIRDLLQVTRLYSVLDIYEFEEDALSSF